MSPPPRWLQKLEADRQAKARRLEAERDWARDAGPQAEEWHPAFLASLAAGANVTQACRAAGISRKQAYVQKRLDAGFSEQWEEALEGAISMLEQIGWERALRKSDALLMFFLRAHRPEKYQATARLEHTGPGGGPIQLTDAERQRVIALYEREHVGSN